MLYIYATTEKYEAAIDRLDEGVLLSAENGEGSLWSLQKKLSK